MNSLNLSLGSLLDQVAEAHGALPAILNEDSAVLSHSELNKHIAETVDVLNSLGVGRNDRVAIVLPQGPELAVAFLSVASGATVAPLNHNYKEEDFLFYLKDLDAKTLILLDGDGTPARKAAESLGIPVLDLKPHPNRDGRFVLSGIPQSLEGSGGFAQADDFGLILHTSGTTSRPKMVPLSHANLCSSTLNIIEMVQLKEGDRCLNVMPLFHIHGLVACVLASLCSGGSTVCTRSFNSEKFFDWLIEFKPTWYSAVPTMHQAVLGQLQNRDQVTTKSALRFIRSSSAALPPSVMKSLRDAFSVPVIESYGMTEAAHQMASNPLPPLSQKPGSVGVAAGPEICILSESGDLISQGEIGEISIRGNNVTNGYENNPEANESSFCRGWFRTGDQGYLDEEGYLFLTGRLKEMINRGGENIAPREIDEALLAHPGVKQAVGFAIPHESLGEDVAAAVILIDGFDLDEASLRAFALEKLPDFKAPSRIVILDDIPKGPTGKLQRIGLADKLVDALKIDYEAPITETEQQVVLVIEEIMNFSSIGRNDNFFSKGGDSLRATQILSRLKENLSLDLPVSLLFQLPTPALLASRLDELITDREIETLAEAMEGLSPEEQASLLNGDCDAKDDYR